MAIWRTRSSRTIANHIRKCMNKGFMGGAVVNQSSWSSTLQSCSLSSLSSHRLVPQNCSYLHPLPCNRATLFSLQRFKSSVAERQLDSFFSSDSDDEQSLDFPGGKVTYTTEMNFISESSHKRIPCYRVLDDDGELIIMDSDFQQVSKEVAVKMYSDMVTLQIMDNIFYEAQRQGRISFYMTSAGEEAINIASAAALSEEDIILPQYREPGVLLWRGFTLQEFANQCFGNKADHGKGRQMPIHYGSKEHNFFTISSPIGTQLPQAAGIAYSLKMDNKKACAVSYIGDGGTSEGDFHAGLNFAAVMEAPVIFFCRNNGWAISTHVSEQFRSDGIVVKGQGYGIRSIRVDGNDALAVYSAVSAAREMAINEQRPILVEALTYRIGHHSTSDDSTKYRALDEIDYWKLARNPVNRFRCWVQRNGWWSEQQETELRKSIRKQLLQAIQVAEKTEKPPLTELFSDVYDHLPSNLLEQEKRLRGTISRHPKDYPSDVSV
ncbi:2-oxoisovalerate dehydrogenase subunit alpha 1, mitochondrial-like isoform X1 [Herrania umbratica]|uniref:3-methyl-2-oxobutanoate dehydrogenase (2-methylpropanoyl-transferring) n=1 Tax=Herrania umbratica TaxID=108875 RepID=A0A6J1ACQ3_9ROSI|nr:2-oxoisovalerate dehydrogenase subunit alpha 1, mitochondrial-like isoform X1 [Herrania umbratica]